MLEAATQVVDEHNWIFPNTTDTLTTLKWVWPYTAEAIKAFAYNEPTLSFDTNLEKIFSRYYFWNKFRKLTKEEKAELLTQILDFCSKSPSIPLIKGEEAQIARDINNALMDYGATVSLNSIANIDWELYPLASSEFYKTRWQLEPIKQKKVSRFPNKEAYVFAILHENHKVYFGKSPLVEGGGWANAKSGGATVPFLIGKNSSDPRAMIQNYFKHNHDLELSVRPPEIKSYNKDEIPYMICYCQIQSGKNKFQKIPWLKVRGFEEWYIEKIAF
jgi:hypothetical protein